MAPRARGPASPRTPPSPVRRPAPSPSAARSARPVSDVRASARGRAPSRRATPRRCASRRRRNARARARSARAARRSPGSSNRPADRLAPGGQPRPLEVARRPAVVARAAVERAEQRDRVARAPRIDHDAVGDLEQAHQQLVIPCRRPEHPDEHGQVGHEQRHDRAGRPPARQRPDGHRDLLAAHVPPHPTDRAQRLEVRLEARGVALGAGLDDERARRMEPGDRGQQAGRAFGLDRVRGDRDQVARAGARDDGATGRARGLLPQAPQLPAERLDVDGERPPAAQDLPSGRVRDHGRLHSRPSRKSSALTASGPQVPAS